MNFSQTPPQKPSSKAKLINNKDVPIIKIQRSNSNSELQSPYYHQSRSGNIQSLHSQLSSSTGHNKFRKELTVNSSMSGAMMKHKGIRRASHESSNYQQKLSLTSVLTPSFARNNPGFGGPQSDTPSGNSDFSFAIRDVGFSERSSGSIGNNFSEDRRRSVRNKDYLKRRTSKLKQGHDFEAGNQKINKKLNSLFTFQKKTGASKEIPIQMRPNEQMRKEEKTSGSKVRKQAFVYLQTRVVTCFVK